MKKINLNAIASTAVSVAGTVLRAVFAVLVTVLSAAVILGYHMGAGAAIGLREGISVLKERASGKKPEAGTEGLPA